jgi:hypothetical protein
MNRPLFTAVLEDNSIFIGGTLQNTKWLEIPSDKKIKRIFYTLPDGNYLCLDLYDKYYHMIEAVTDLSGKNAGKVDIECAYIMGRKDNKITVYNINIKNGNILRTEYDKNDSFICGLNVNGWK